MTTTSRNPARAFRPETGSIPTEPGCYLFRDAHGKVVYVGKAKVLRQRLSSYFNAWNQIPARTKGMLESARSVEWIVVSNEVEALHLEYNLIKQHRPRFNVKYRDDKSYPYLVLTTSEEVPRARVARNVKIKGDRKFGPYAHAYAIRDTLDLLLRVFPVRTCSQGVYDRCERSGKPCLYYHIGRCAAPCVGHISIEDHRVLVEDLADFLDGRTKAVLDRLERQMHEAATDQNYEAAARLRDQLFAAKTALEKQQMASSNREDFDVVSVVEDDLEAAVQVFFVRGGRVVGRKGWTVDKIEPLTKAELLTSFVLQLYEEHDDDVPPLVIVEELPDEHDALAALLEELRGTRVRFHVPQRGEKVDILTTVADNARQAFQRHRMKRASDFNTRSQALRELQDALALPESPLRIECYDISHLGGTEVVASMVVFEDGLPKKSDYRRFKLTHDTNDDFAAMREVIRRRFARYVEELSQPLDDDGTRRKFSYPPNLVIIDGGPGQLGAALEGFADVGSGLEAGEGGPSFVSLSKRYEELHLPGSARPVALPRGSDALYLVQRIRDEAHRFAITYQRQRRTAGITSTALDGVPGVGPTRRRAILKHFGSVKRATEATLDELAEVPGLSSTLATAVYAHLHDDEATT